MDPFLVPIAQPHKGKATQQSFHMLGLSPPPQTNSCSPCSPSPQSCNPPPKATKGFGNGPSNVDNVTDDNKNQSSPHSQISNLHHKLLHGTYEQIHEIFHHAAKETNWPLKGTFTNYTQKHGQSSRKSDSNMY